VLLHPCRDVDRIAKSSEVDHRAPDVAHVGDARVDGQRPQEAVGRLVRVRFVNVGSTVLVRGSPRAPQYEAGKYGLLGVTKSYARALAPSVRVNTFAPGFMETEALLARPEWKAGRRDTVLAGTPAGKIPQPEEMTGAALFLASDDAHHITGSYMIADGGYSMLGA